MEQCKACRYFRSLSEADDASIYGDCRRYPPMTVSDFIDDSGFANPFMHVDDWCGEFKEAVEND